jgi:hypothetical protein
VGVVTTLVFASRVGTERNSGNVLRLFRVIVARTGLNEHDWTPREMRHSFVSLLSDSGVRWRTYRGWWATPAAAR